MLTNNRGRNVHIAKDSRLSISEFDNAPKPWWIRNFWPLTISGLLFGWFTLSLIPTP
jgi:hypothetical protein